MKINAKSLLALLLALVLALSLVACGQTAPAESESEGSDEPAADTEETVEAPKPEYTVDYTKYFDENGYWIGIKAADYVVLPEDYMNVSVPADVLAVSDTEMEDAISNILSNFPVTEQITDRAVENGDQVNIDYVGSIDGVEFDGGSTNGQGTTVTAGSTNYIDDFLTQIIGHKPGETINVEVTFPEDYGVEDLNGKDAVFVTTINYIEEQKAPELNDAFVAENLNSLYNVSTVEELKEYLNTQLSDEKKQEFVFTHVIEDSELSQDIPQLLMDYQKEDMLAYYAQYAAMYGVSMDEFLSTYVGVDGVDALLDDQTMESMNRYAKQYLVNQAIAEEQGLVVDEDALKAYMLEVTGSEDYASYEESFGRSYLVWNALSYTAFNTVMENAAPAK